MEMYDGGLVVHVNTSWRMTDDVPDDVYSEADQWSDWVDDQIRSEDAVQPPEWEDWVVTEDGPQWREG